MTNKIQSGIFQRKKVVGLNRQEYLDRKLLELCDACDERDSSERGNGNENILQTNNGDFNGTWDTDEIQPVVISVYTSDAPTKENPTSGLFEEQLAPKTATTEENTLQNSTLTEDSMHPPPVKGISVFNNDWNDNDSLTIPTIDDNDDSTLPSLPSIDDDDDETCLDQRDDDSLSVIPLPADVIWSDLYRNCGVEAAEHVTDNLVVHFPRAVSRYFVWNDRKQISKDHEYNTDVKSVDRGPDKTKITSQEPLQPSSPRQKKAARANDCLLAMSADRRREETKITRREPHQPSPKQKKGTRAKESVLVTVWKAPGEGRDAISDEYSEGMASF